MQMAGNQGEPVRTRLNVIEAIRAALIPLGYPVERTSHNTTLYPDADTFFVVWLYSNVSAFYASGRPLCEITRGQVDLWCKDGTTFDELAHQAKCALKAAGMTVAVGLEQKEKDWYHLAIDVGVQTDL